MTNHMRRPHDAIMQIENMDRLTNTSSGNPRWQINFAGSVRRTRPDAAIANEISNSEYQGRPIRLWYDDKGQIMWAEPA